MTNLKRDFVIWVLGNESREYKMDLLHLYNTIYLLAGDVKDRFNVDIGYSFDSFTTFTGPYDKNLGRDLDVWDFLDLIVYTESDMKIPSAFGCGLTDLGQDYLDRFANKALRTIFDKEEFRQMKDLLKKYDGMTNKELVSKSMERLKNENKVLAPLLRL